jgi:addiction module HigA family antidote
MIGISSSKTNLGQLTLGARTVSDDGSSGPPSIVQQGPGHDDGGGDRLPPLSKNGLPPVHPGEIIKQDILPCAGLSVMAAAKALGVCRQMLHDILAERKPLSAVMCLKVSRSGCGCRQPTI